MINEMKQDARLDYSLRKKANDLVAPNLMGELKMTHNEQVKNESRPDNTPRNAADRLANNIFAFPIEWAKSKSSEHTRILTSTRKIYDRLSTMDHLMST